MNKYNMKNFIVHIILLILTFSVSYAQNEVLLCPPIKGGTSLYNEDAIAKNKFDSKHYSNLSTYFKPIVFGECYTKGKNIIQILYIDGASVAMVFPEKVKIEALDGSHRAYADYRYFRNALGKGDTKATRQGGVNFSWYPYSLYQELNSRADSVYYYIGDAKRYKHGFPYRFSRPTFRAPKANNSSNKVQFLNVALQPLFKEDNSLVSRKNRDELKIK